MTRSSPSRIFRHGIAGLVMLAIWLGTGLSWAADEPEIQVAISADEIFVGDSVDFHVEIRNSKNPSAPDMSAVKAEFEVVANGDESRNQSSTFIINGRVTQQSVFSHVYHFRLIPKTAGKLTIPAVTATVDGKMLSGNEVALRVIEPEKQDLVLVEIEISHAKVYPTQPFTVTARVLVRPLPNDGDLNPLSPLRRRPPHLQVNWVDPESGLKVEEKTRWLQPLLTNDGIGFTLNDVAIRTGSFFDGDRSAVLALSKGREVRDGLDDKPIRYFVYELSRTITPEKTGDYSFGPIIVKGTFVSGVEQREYVARRLVAIAPATTVEVREVPSPRPPTFCGGIGKYQVTAAASPTTLRVGDPLTLMLDFERGAQSGSLELISAPDLSKNTQLAADFDLIDKNPTGRIEGSVKKFAYAIRPKRPDVSIPALSISTFDPQTEEFVETGTSAIPLEVSESGRVTGGDLVGSMPSTGSNTIKTRAEGISQNIIDPSELRDERLSLIAWSEAVLAIWAMAGLLMLIVPLYGRKSSDFVWQRRQQARRSAQRKLTEARTSLAEGRSDEALGQARSAIIGLVADTQNRIAEGLTTVDVAQILSTAAVPVEDRSDVLQLLESIESAEYGGGRSADPAAAIETATTLIARISPLLERGF